MTPRRNRCLNGMEGCGLTEQHWHVPGPNGPVTTHRPPSLAEHFAPVVAEARKAGIGVTINGATPEDELAFGIEPFAAALDTPAPKPAADAVRPSPGFGRFACPVMGCDRLDEHTHKPTAPSAEHSLSRLHDVGAWQLYGYEVARIAAAALQKIATKEAP